MAQQTMAEKTVRDGSTIRKAQPESGRGGNG